MFKKECTFFLVVLFKIFVVQDSSAQKSSWKIQPVSIQTRWARDVNPNAPLPEYPRPQLVRENNWQNLNGLWEYAITTKSAPKPKTFQGKILVPYPIESALSGVKSPLKPSENLWYYRSFKVSAAKGQRTLLHFGAVDWETTVYINGKEVGSHTGGYTGFSFDITNFSKAGTNELVVRVYDPTDQGIGPHGKQVLNPGNIYYTASSGIWQTVWLETVPTTYISDLKFTPNIDERMLDLKVSISDVVPPQAGISVEAIVSSEGKEILKQVQDDNKNVNMALKVPNAHLWSPDDPFLYDLTIKLRRNGELLDEVKSYFGMRKVDIAKDADGIDRIFLNNKPIYNCGTLDQGFWPEGLYTAPTDVALKFDIQAIKSMGFNTIRKHIKVEPARWYYHADKLGIMVWQDFVNPNQGLPERAKTEYEKDLEQTLKQLYNSPSVTTWVIFNEKWGAYDQKRITKWVKQLDSSRIVNGHSGEMLYVNGQLRNPAPDAWIAADIADIHAYPYPLPVPILQGKARVVGEFGGVSVPVYDHIWNESQTGWGYTGLVSPKALTIEYKKMTDTLLKQKANGLSGSIYTQPFDVETEQNGLITYDREVCKIPLDFIKANNSRLERTFASTFDNDLKITLADTTANDFNAMLTMFLNGKSDKKFLFRFASASLQERQDSLLQKIVQSYVIQIQPRPQSIDIQFLQTFMRDTSDLCFKYVITQLENIKKHASKSEIGGLIGAARGTLSAALRPMILKTTSNDTMDTIEKVVVSKYGEIGQAVVWQEFALSEYFRNDIEAWYKSKLKINKKYPESISTFDLNNDAWFLFETTHDREKLESALQWSKRVIEAEPTANYYDTYANILYKLGKNDLAIEMQEKALTLDPGNGYIEAARENLSKMKKGLPTWK